MSDDLMSGLIASVENLRVTMQSKPVSPRDPVSFNANSIFESIDYAVDLVSTATTNSALSMMKPSLAALITAYERALRCPNWEPVTGRTRASFHHTAVDFLSWFRAAPLKSALDAVHTAVKRETPETYDPVQEVINPLNVGKAWLAQVQRIWPMDEASSRTPESIEEARMVIAMCMSIQKGLIREVLPPGVDRMGILGAANQLAAGTPLVDRDGQTSSISMCIKAWFHFLRLTKFNLVVAHSVARTPNNDTSQMGNVTRMGFGSFATAINMDIAHWLSTPYLKMAFGGDDLLIRIMSSVGVNTGLNTMAGGRRHGVSWHMIVAASIACTTASLVAAL